MNMDGVVYDQDFTRDSEQSSPDEKRYPVDVVVGTPMKLLEKIRGRGWDRSEAPPQQDLGDDGDAADAEHRKLRRGRDKMPHVGTWKARSELGLENIEWVVVDEADVLFGMSRPFYLLPH